jgi:endonuclease YncB( thermonuclease family)
MTLKNRQIIQAALLLATLTLSVIAQQRTITGKVIAITDGDTITVLDSGKQQHKIRLDGIDAPEASQPFGTQAKKALSDLVFGRNVTVISSNTHRYGAAVGKVLLDGKDINYVQVMHGFAWFYLAYAHELKRDDAQAYEQAEAKARADRRGLWTDASPAPPWEYRKGKREAVTKVKPGANGRIIGNRGSRVYHRPDCPAYNDVGERNRVFFKTAAEAERAGFRLAGNCPRVPGSGSARF